MSPLGTRRSSAFLAATLFALFLAGAVPVRAQGDPRGQGAPWVLDGTPYRELRGPRVRVVFENG